MSLGVMRRRRRRRRRRRKNEVEEGVYGLVSSRDIRMGEWFRVVDSEGEEEEGEEGEEGEEF